MAVVNFAGLRFSADADREESSSPEFVETSGTAFAFVHTESVAEIEGRRNELESILEGGLSIGIAKLFRELL